MPRILARAESLLLPAGSLEGRVPPDGGCAIASWVPDLNWPLVTHHAWNNSPCAYTTSAPASMGLAQSPHSGSEVVSDIALGGYRSSSAWTRTVAPDSLPIIPDTLVLP